VADLGGSPLRGSGAFVVGTAWSDWVGTKVFSVIGFKYFSF